MALFSGDESLSGELPSLLHFAARHGLQELVSRLTDLPGAREACSVRNKNGYSPVELALLHDHKDIAGFLKEYLKTVSSVRWLCVHTHDDS